LRGTAQRCFVVVILCERRNDLDTAFPSDIAGVVTH
jgi:hypothetical protein